MIKRLIVTFCIMLISLATFSQMKEIGKFTAGGVNDAEELLKAYITPWANALGTSLCGGWYNTAKVHKLGGFDITFTANMAFVPDAEKTFNLEDLDLSVNASGKAQTAAGKDISGPAITYPNLGGLNYRTPQGVGLGFIPTPMVQLGLGLIKGTEITGRFMPNVELGKKIGSFGLWGIGIKHDILQWLPVAEKLPVLNVSIQGGYTNMIYRKTLSFLPEQIGIDDANVDESLDFDNQELNLIVESLTANLLVSANLPVVCFYGGVGIANTKTEFSLKGLYPIPELINQELVVTQNSAKEDPVTMEIKNKEGSATKPRLNIGMRLKLGVLTLHGDYTKAYYSNVTVGLGFTFR